MGVNIVNTIVNKAKLKRWGFLPDAQTDRAVAINYLNQLGCDGIFLKSCDQLDIDCNCTSALTDVKCDIVINAITALGYNSVNGEISFQLGVSDVIDAKLPLSYSWSYDHNIFDIVGTNTNQTVIFTLKNGIQPDTVVTPITINITDSKGCIASKTCYYTGGTMKCKNNFIPCRNSKGLQVNYIFVSCAKPKGLVVQFN